MFCEKQRQSGRSMTEMLMVLGIMGVLSIVIVVGLRYALTKTKATKIVDDARKRLLAVSTTPHPRVGNIV